LKVFLHEAYGISCFDFSSMS